MPSVSLCSLPCSSPPSLHSLSPCVTLHHPRVSFSSLSVFPLRPLSITPAPVLSLSLYLSSSPRGHWGQAWCSGLVDKYHVRPFHVFSSLPIASSGSREQRSFFFFFSAYSKVYLHFEDVEGLFARPCFRCATAVNERDQVSVLMHKPFVFFRL